MTDQYYKLNENDSALLETTDLIAVQLQNNNLEAFLHNWETTINGLRKIPDEELMEDLFRKQLKKCTELDQIMALYELDHTQRKEPRSYAKLFSMVKIHIDTKLREKHRETWEKSQQRQNGQITPAADPKKTTKNTA